MQRDVRTCMEKMNIKVVELDECYEDCQFDGPGRYAMPSKRKRGMAPKRMAAQAANVLPIPEGGILPLMEAQAQKCTTDRVAVYGWSAGRGIELGGGIRSLADLDEVFALGVYLAVIGSAAVSDP